MLHTSDVHISGDAAADAGLELTVDVAIACDVDVVLIAGDLFDSARVRDDAVARTIGLLRRLGRPVVVIPGNHDCIDERSIYHRAHLSDAGDHVHFVGNPAGEEVVFEDLSLIVWARGIESHDPSHRPLAGYTPADPGYWSVVLTHGHFVANEERSDRSSPIRQEEIGQLRCHYLALGHWHRYLDVSEGGVTAFYSGSPCDPAGGGTSVNLVTLDPDSGVNVERRMIGRNE
jgi:DNA repair exonuclease SbcCD nuclease subunit